MNRKRWVGVGLCGVLAGFAVVATSCLDATEITIKLSTNVACARKPSADIFLGATDAPLAQTTACTNGSPANYVGSIVLVPHASQDERVVIRVVGTIDESITADECARNFATKGIDHKLLASCIEARRSLAFIQHKPLEIPIVLDSSCAGVSCDAGQTCIGGKCVSDEVGCDKTAGKCGGPDASTDASALDAITAADVILPGAPATPERITARGNTTCVVTTTHRVQCWGSNADGQMGMAPSTNLDVPTDTGLIDVGTLALGQSHGCALSFSSGDVYCWGSNQYGEVTGLATTTFESATNVKLNGAQQYIAVGDAHSCSAQNPGNIGTPSVTCWGDYKRGQLGTAGVNAASNAPIVVAVNNPTKVLALAAGANHTCALIDAPASDGGSLAGAVTCWGDNKLGQCGTNGGSSAGFVDEGNAFAIRDNVAVGAGANHSAAIGSYPVFWWGDNANLAMTAGQSGPKQSTLATPLSLPNLKVPTVLSVSDQHVCASNASGAMSCWGNDIGQLGGTPKNGFVSVPLSGVSGIATGVAHTCAIANSPNTNSTAKVVYCWGENKQGQLGVGANLASQTTPQQVTLANE